MSEQLKPCPFCGSAKVEHVGIGWVDDFSVACNECGAGVGLYPTEAQAAEAWNRRAETKVRATERAADHHGVKIETMRGSVIECRAQEGMGNG